MVKLAEGDEMQHAYIEVRSLPAYYMNIEECMSVEVEINGKSQYHDIKAFIKDGEYHLESSIVRKSSSGAWRAIFLSGEILYKRNHDTTLDA